MNLMLNGRSQSCGTSVNEWPRGLKPAALCWRVIAHGHFGALVLVFAWCASAPAETPRAPQALPTILKLADSENLPIRVAALRALGSQPGRASTDKLLSALRSEKRVNVLMAACVSLGRLKDPRAVTPLVEAIERSVTELHDNNLRVAAGAALEAITGQEYGPHERRWRQALKDGKLGS